MDTIKKVKRGKSVTPWIAPSIIVLLLITILPTLFLFYLSLNSWELATPWDTRKLVWLKNFIDDIKDEQFQNSLVVTMKYVVVVVLLEFVFGLIIAAFIKGQNPGMRIFMIVALILPMTLTPSVAGLIWRSNFHPVAGVVNYFLSSLFGLKINWYSKEYALLSTMIVDIWQWTPFTSLILFSGMEAVSQDCYEAAMIDGASSFKVLTRITIPLLKPVILIVLLMRIMDALKMFDVVFVMTEGGPGNTTELLSLNIYRIGFFHTGYLGRASSIAVILLILVTILSQILIRSFGAREEGKG
ncbi:MAG: sugar ABC transporter permease [Candidatus Atribacteria bacterium]|nr:sugar ABC transporter permease [Candidatus Atribacteria bacterium]